MRASSFPYAAGVRDPSNCLVSLFGCSLGQLFQCSIEQTRYHDQPGSCFRVVLAHNDPFKIRFEHSHFLDQFGEARCVGIRS
jgi:hypothetical protein